MARKGHTYPALQLAVIIRRRKEVPGRWAEPLEGGENSRFFSPSNIQIVERGPQHTYFGQSIPSNRFHDLETGHRDFESRFMI